LAQSAKRGHVGTVTWGHGVYVNTRVGERQRYRAKVQIGAELLCKGERGEAARGHVGMVTWGQGEEAVLKGGHYSRAGGHEGRRAGVEGRRTRGHAGWMGPTPGFRRLMAERLIPERPTTVAVTRHLRMNHDRSKLSGFRSPLEWKYSRQLPTGAATRHLRIVKQQLCRDAVPTLPKSRQLEQHAVLPLPRYSGCDVIASLPCFAASSLWRTNRQPLSANRQHLCNSTVSLY